MSNLAGPSTPSKKRSKWDEDELLEVQVQPPITKKKSKKSKSAKEHTPPSATSDSEPSTSRPPRLSHSVYVPPRGHHPSIIPSRSVYCYERLNQIEEGSYGIVFRARDRETGDIVALKKLKLEEEKHGFPITALREINALMTCRHDNVVNIREVVVGDTLTQYVSRISCLYINLNMTRHPCTTRFASIA
jgi:cell division cycle 2-like